MFYTDGFEVETDATGYVAAEIGFEACVPSDPDDRPELVGIDEVTLEGVTYTFEELQAAGFRTLAHVLAEHVADEVANDPGLQEALFEEAREDTRCWWMESY